MATIKIQSVEDIIEAYFSNFGFSGDVLKKLTERVSAEFRESKQSDVVCFLEDFVLKRAEKAENLFQTNRDIRIAQFKLVFLESDDKSKYECFLENRLEKVFEQAKRVKIFENAPAYNLTEMKAQKIEVPEAHSWFNPFRKML